MEFPQIDPVAFSAFGWPVHWYGLAYVAAFFIGMAYIKRSFITKPVTGFSSDKVDDVFTWIILGIILGGRLGYVIFYNPSYYLANPDQILMTMNGGMSFHGGLLGVISGCLLFCYKNKLNFFDLMDRLAPATCIGLLLGRMANFINGELYGNVTTAKIGMIFPHGGPLARHPSQLYEAALEGLVLFIILHTVLKMREKPRRMEISGLFLIGYGSFRYIIEFFRSKDAHLTEGVFAYISMGQILCIPMVLFGTFLVHKAYKQNKAQTI